MRIFLRRMIGLPLSVRILNTEQGILNFEVGRAAIAGMIKNAGS
jgi:hypothetical protein